MADKTENRINLKFLARQNERVLNEIASFREDMTVLTAIAMRLESAVDSLKVAVRPLSSKLSRIESRVTKLEDAR
jgi:hypothetical protein